VVGGVALPYPMHQALIENGMEIQHFGSGAFQVHQHGVVTTFCAPDGEFHSFDAV